MARENGARERERKEENSNKSTKKRNKFSLKRRGKSFLVGFSREKERRSESIFCGKLRWADCARERTTLHRLTDTFGLAGNMWQGNKKATREREIRALEKCWAKTRFEEVGDEKLVWAGWLAGWLTGMHVFKFCVFLWNVCVFCTWVNSLWFWTTLYCFKDYFYWLICYFEVP